MLTEKQLELRKTGIGASEAISVLGLDEYRSPLDVYNQKVGDIEVNNEEPGQQVIWGQLFEDVIARRASELYGIEIINPGRTYRHKKYPFILATPDRLIKGSNEGIEIKNRSSWMVSKYGDEHSDEVLTSDIIQCQQNMLVTDRVVWHLFVLFGGNTLKRFRIERNEKLIEKIIDRETIFWNEHVVKRVPPDPINNRDLDSLSQDIVKDQSIICNHTLIEKIELLKNNRSLIKCIEKQNDQIEFELKSALSTSEYLCDQNGNRLISWKNVETNRLDNKRIKNDIPDVYNSYCSKSTSRVFRIL